MTIIKKRSVVEVFYYLMAIDGDPDQIMMGKFFELGAEVDAEGFPEYRDELIDYCSRQKLRMIDPEDYYDVLAECVDRSLKQTTDNIEEGMTSRMLVWNLLVNALYDRKYSDNERRLIKHIVRVLNIETSVFLEMEQLIRTSVAVNDEIEWLKTSDRPFNEISPIFDEAKRRAQVIAESAMALIEDEMYEKSIDALEVKDDFVDIARKKVEETVAPVTEKIEEAINPVKDKVIEKAAPVAEDIAEKAGKFVGDAKKTLFKAFSKKKNDKDEKDDDDDFIGE